MKKWYKVRVEKIYDGTVRAAVVREKESPEKPKEYFKKYFGMVVIMEWFDNLDEANEYVRALRAMKEVA